MNIVCKLIVVPQNPYCKNIDKYCLQVRRFIQDFSVWSINLYILKDADLVYTESTFCEFRELRIL